MFGNGTRHSLKCRFKTRTLLPDKIKVSNLFLIEKFFFDETYIKLGTIVNFI